MVLARLVAVSGALAPERVPVDHALARYGLDSEHISVYRRFYGLEEVRLNPGTGMAGLLTAAAAGLDPPPGREIRYLLHARTMPVAAPFGVNPLHEARDALGLGHALAFTVTQHACASGLLAVRLAATLLEGDGDPDALALVLAGEKTFTSCARVIEDTAVLGEDSAAVLVGLGEGGDRLLGYATRTRGEFHHAPWLSERENAAFTDAYPDTLAEVMLAAIGESGLDPADIDLILPHNVNRMSWMRVLRKAGIRDRGRLFLDNLASGGHCFCADSFLNYVTARERGLLKPGDRYLMTAVGLGATFSAMVFQH